eukprot:TRINITY_DN11322_c0_g3_i1.p1 TRINITY_DN11322_c0_g3~~TRINITY_DN11322_c0_g3_i1.p1  ORF type:complete len:557 (-),score=44.08 TRINITY_DN11322_c0_g3_i1:325-1995(-)
MRRNMFVDRYFCSLLGIILLSVVSCGFGSRIHPGEEPSHGTVCGRAQCESSFDTCYRPCQAQRTVGFCNAWEKVRIIDQMHRVQGECYRRQYAECDIDRDCPPASFCGAPRSDGAKGVQCESCPAHLDQSSRCLQKAVEEAIERWRFLSSNIDVAAPVSHTIRQYQSLNVTPAAGWSHDIVNSLVHHASPFNRTGKGRSRSGAVFYLSSDNRYIVKGFLRSDEYAEMANLVKTFRPGDDGTLLSLPALVFPAFGSTYWSVMPNMEFQARALLSLEESTPAKTFDAKPAPLISQDRASLLLYLREIQFQVEHLASAKTSSFQLALLSDLAYLEARNIVDYSLLVKAFEIPNGEHVSIKPSISRPTLLQPWCFRSSPRVSTVESFVSSKGDEKLIVVCFAIIDFSLALQGFRMHVESTLLRSKWDKYASKFNQLTKCIFLLGPPASDMLEQLRASSLQWYVENTSISNSGQTEYAVRISVAHTMRLHQPTECFEYREAACNPVVRSLQRCEAGKCTNSTTTCLFFLNALQSTEAYAQAEYCMAYLLERCIRSRIGILF